MLKYFASPPATPATMRSSRERSRRLAAGSSVVWVVCSLMAPESRSGAVSAIRNDPEATLTGYGQGHGARSSQASDRPVEGGAYLDERQRRRATQVGRA